MKEKWMEMQDILEEMKSIKKKEYWLMLAVCLLMGIVIGVFFSPKKRVMIGSNNTLGGSGQEDCCCDEDCCGDEDCCCAE